MNEGAKEIIRKALRIVSAALAAMGGMWTLLEIGGHYLDRWKIVILMQDDIRAIVVPGILAALWECHELLKTEYSLTYEAGGKKIMVRCGNILHKRKGTVAVGINDQLVTSRDKIGAASIHRQLVDKYGEEDVGQLFRRGSPYVENGRKFFHGTLKDRKFLFLAMSHLGEEQAVHANIGQLVGALQNLFYNQQELSLPSGRLYVPVLGAGECGLAPDMKKLIEIIVDEFLQFQNERCADKSDKIEELCIVVYWKKAVKIPWKDLRESLEARTSRCRACSGFENMLKAEEMYSQQSEGMDMRNPER